MARRAPFWFACPMYAMPPLVGATAPILTRRGSALADAAASAAMATTAAFVRDCMADFGVEQVKRTQAAGRR